MELTGQCKEEFEKWSVNQDFWDEEFDLLELSDSMKYGLYLDFFDYVGYNIDSVVDSYAIFSNNTITYLGVESVIEGYVAEKDEISTRKETREQAITKANELYNER